jgi:hypothetical protein
MDEQRLSRLFQHIVAATLPLSAAMAPAACSSSPSAVATSDAGPLDGAPNTGSDAEIAVTSCGLAVQVNTGDQFSPELVDGRVVGCGIAQCSVWDGGPLDASGADCANACGSSVSTCATYLDAGVLVLQCSPFACLGRRPEELEALRIEASRAGRSGGDVLATVGVPRSARLGAYLAEAAYLEAASVDAFRRLRRELISHGAPRRLTRAAERAARDEIRHARVTSALARRHGETAPRARRGSRAVRDLPAIAIENAVEGCVREAYGALVATWQAETAADAGVRAAMKRIARDETRHAALAFAVDAWVRGRLDAKARERVERSKSEALAELVNGAETPELMRAALGLPNRAQARALVAAMAQELTSES